MSMASCWELSYYDRRGISWVSHKPTILKSSQIIFPRFFRRKYILSPEPISIPPPTKLIGLSMRGRDVGCEGVCDDDNLKRRRSIFDTIEDPVKETVRLFFSNQANFEDEATLLVYAGKRDADCLEERFITELNWENRVMAGIIADAIVAFRNNPGQLLLFRSFLSALSSPFSRTYFNSSSNIEW
jgi:hypothetical protein